MGGNRTESLPQDALRVTLIYRKNSKKRQLKNGQPHKRHEIWLLELRKLQQKKEKKDFVLYGIHNFQKVDKKWISIHCPPF